MNPEWKEREPGVMVRDYGPLCGRISASGWKVPGYSWSLMLGNGAVRWADATSIEDAAAACDKAVEALLAAIETHAQLTVARALRTPAARRGIPIRFRYAEPTETSDGRIIIRYNPRIDEFDHLDKTNWLPYRLTIDDLDRPAELMFDGVDMEG